MVGGSTAEHNMQINTPPPPCVEGPPFEVCLILEGVLLSLLLFLSFPLMQFVLKSFHSLAFSPHQVTLCQKKECQNPCDPVSAWSHLSVKLKGTLWGWLPLGFVPQTTRENDSLIACYPLVGISYLGTKTKPLTSTRQLPCEPRLPSLACYPLLFSSNRKIAYTILQFPSYLVFNILLNYSLSLEVDI